VPHPADVAAADGVRTLRGERPAARRALARLASGLPAATLESGIDLALAGLEAGVGADDVHHGRAPSLVDLSAAHHAAVETEPGVHRPTKVFVLLHTTPTVVSRLVDVEGVWGGHAIGIVVHLLALDPLVNLGAALARLERPPALVALRLVHCYACGVISSH
jgi:hypothetical protein